jgi:hypothetical protein
MGGVAKRNGQRVEGLVSGQARPISRSFRPRWFGGSGLALGFMIASIASLSAVTLKPKAFPLKVLGVQVDLPATIAFDMKTEGDAVVLQLSAEANLKNLQDAALQIARALPVPRGNCDREGVNPVVNSIDNASISPSGDTAVVAISGHVTAWACIKPAGIVMKTEGPHDSVSITAPVRIFVTDGKQLGLQLAGPVTVKTGNALTAEAIQLFTGDISASITKALTNALNADEARAKLPSLPGLEAAIKDAAFAADGNALLIRAHGSARMTSDTFNSLLDTLSK